ncbi:MAG: 4Fe-4S ferredoxin, partial [Oscillospiraceae bacterium]|nr:4Fe-4S ferredoxin [Oscillospiraceae bacterium]
MKRVYVNEKWCLGCHLCEYYCAFAAMGETDMARALKDVKIRPKIRVEGQNTVSFAVACRHCDDALCVKGCLTGALTKTDGVVTIDHDKCIGCFTCVLCCPFGSLSPTED